VEEGQFRLGGTPTPSNNMTFPIVKRDRARGIEEIAAGIKHSNEEHSWVYIPQKHLWVDTTLYVEERSVYQDPILIEALQETFGAVEVFHSHPPKITAAVEAERTFGMPHVVTGALPTIDDLSTLTRSAWGSDRSIPKISGVIHPLGVTYYLPTKELLTSGIGPGLKDIGSLYGNYDSKLDAISAIHSLVMIQNEVLRIELYDGQPSRPGFKIKFFPLESLDQADRWLNENMTSLAREEALKYRR
jgi:hypothetical protein